MSQLAIANGRVELCDFLLTRYESFRNLIEFGLSSLLRQQPGHLIRPSVLELLASKYGIHMDIDANALCERITPPRYWYSLGPTVLFHQRSLIDHLPIQERLHVAMSFQSLEDFMRAVGSANWNDLAHCSTPFGKTALHWAAMHCVRRSGDTEHGEYPTKSIEISNFIANLLRTGAPPHALDAHGETPLLSLTYHTALRSRNLVRFQEKCGQALGVWSSILTACGLSLSTYAERENELSGSKYVETYEWYPQKIMFEGVFVSNVVLIIEWSTRSCVEIWQHQFPPGSFLCYSQDQPVICWDPTDYDGTNMYWQQVRTVHPRPRLLRSPPPELAESLHGAMIAVGMFDRAQDDHGIVAATIRNNQISVDRGHLKRSRGSSAPPLGRFTADGLCGKFIGKKSRLGRHLHQWEVDVFRCPVTATWCLSKLYGDPMQAARQCMNGCHGVHGLLGRTRSKLLYEYR